MKNQSSKGKLQRLYGLLVSGSIAVRMDKKELAKVEIRQGNMDILLKDDKKAKELSKVIPHSLKRMKTIHLLSRIVARMGITVDVNDKNGLLLKFGYGVHSILGNFEVKILKLRKYL